MTKPVTKRQAKINSARRQALIAALEGKTEANAESLTASYGLPIHEVRNIMLAKGVNDNG